MLLQHKKYKQVFFPANPQKHCYVRSIMVYKILQQTQQSCINQKIGKLYIYQTTPIISLSTIVASLSFKSLLILEKHHSFLIHNGPTKLPNLHLDGHLHEIGLHLLTQHEHPNCLQPAILNNLLWLVQQISHPSCLISVISEENLSNFASILSRTSWTYNIVLPQSMHHHSSSLWESSFIACIIKIGFFQPL